MTRVYVSSTYADLAEARASVCRALREAGCEVVAMEEYLATGRPPLEKCLADVRSCEVYVGIVAWRYGFVPPGGKISITEAEYHEAARSDIPRLLFLLHEDAPWPRRLIDRDEGPIESLRAHMTENHVVQFFRSADELPELVRAAVAAHEREADAARTQFLRSPWLGIEFRQGGARSPMRAAAPDIIRVTMRQSPFEMHVPKVGPNENVMVCASYDDAVFGQIGEGMRLEDVPFFWSGTGMADTSFGSAELWVNAEAHNHLDWGGRLVPRPEGGGVALFHSITDKPGQGGLPKGRDVFLVVRVGRYGGDDEQIELGTFERFILSF